MQHRRFPRPELRWTPRRFLQLAERKANCLRKQLQAFSVGASGNAGSMGDAIALTLLIEQLSQKGRNADADEATEIAEKVDLLVDLLWTEIDELLAS